MIALSSKIEWTEATWNPVRGCTKISPGCKHCYAETFAERFRGVKGHPYEQGFELRLVPEKLNEPFQWPSPKLVFVNSMSDLFHSGVPDDYVEAVSRVMAIADWHTYQVLTKRSERLCSLLNGKLRFAADRENIWWGVSVEDRKHGLPRVADLHLSAIILLQTFESAQCCTSELHSRDYKHGHDEKIVPADIRVGFSPATSPPSFCRMADRYSEAFPCSARTPLLRTGERRCRCFQLLSTGRANPGSRGTRPLLLTSGVSNELERDWHPIQS